MTTARISLDSPVFNGRLRNFERRSLYERREVRVGRAGLVSDIRPTTSKAQPKPAKPERRHAVAPAVQARTERSVVLKRQTVQTPVVERRSKPNSTQNPLQKKLLTALAILLFVVGVGVAVDGILANRHVEAQVDQMASSGGAANDTGAPMVGDVPGEGEAPDVSAYRVAATLPRKITIPKLAVEARTIKLGTTASGALASPSNIYDAGWYADSAKPGEAGAMLIDGHVHGPTKPGVFYDLKTLKPGDEISVERGDGKTFSYKVVKKETYPADSMDMMGAALTPATADRPGLNLITCTGELDKATNHYKERLVIFAEQL